MKITGAKKEPQYASSVSVDWASRGKYRVEVRSADFHQIRTVDGDQINEETTGNFYPGWLHSFVTALLDPFFMKPLLLAPKAALEVSRNSSGDTVSACINRNDRPGGITDDMTWGGVCISDDGRLLNAHNFTTWMDFSDYKSFSKKKVARTYTTYAGSYDEIKGTLTILRSLKATELDSIRVMQASPRDKQIAFAFISSKAAEARTESAKPYEWPPIREGKTEGYMIVHVQTDVTGQVREASKHNSDNPGLEEAGRQAALGYKFKPMLIDGAPVQMEIPLILHFASKIADPLPVLRGAELLKQIRGCNTKLISDLKGTLGTPTHISINESGQLTGEGFGPQVNVGNPAVVVTLPPDAPSAPPHALGLDCRFAPLTHNGVTTYYHGDLLVTRGE